MHDEDALEEPYDLSEDDDPADDSRPMSFREPLSDKYFRCEKEKIEIQLRCLLKYPRMLALTNSLDFIRLVCYELLPSLTPSLP